jgi:hypothetical protein
VVLQALAPHAKGAQVVVDGVGQLPPLQLAAAVATPAAQLAATHWLVGYTHAPLPLAQAEAPQAPPVTQAAPQQMPPRQAPERQALLAAQAAPAAALAVQAAPLQ